MNEYDVAIIGAGPAGIFSAYELIGLSPDLRIALIDAGEDIYSRHCPMTDGSSDHCAKCRTCGIMRGFGGAGAFSDGKYNLTSDFGGWLNDYLSDEAVMELIHYADAINMEHGAPEESYSTHNSQIERQALQHDIHLLQARVKHLGTENNLEILKRIYQRLSDGVSMFFQHAVDDIFPQNGSFQLQFQDGSEPLHCRYLIAAPGRAGAEWFTKQCRRLGLSLSNNQVDVGVRVEVPAATLRHITEEVYEAKLVYRTKQYEDLVRTFCMNPNGYVVAENTDGIITVNGHSYRDPSLHSENTNFALLVSNHLTHPFNEPHQYGRRIASFSNLLGGGVLLQRFGDLMKGRRSNAHRIERSFTRPTLKATAGDLSLVLPKRHLDNIIEMIYALDKIAPGTANHDTLLYGVEVKFYSARLKLNAELETEIPNFFAIGDGAGLTRGLSQASASGIHAARIIQRRLEQ